MNKGKVTTIILVIVIIILGGGLIYVLTEGSNTNSSNSVSNTNTQAVNKNSNAETSGSSYSIEYKTDISQILFTNERYNYNVLIPDDWTIDEIDLLSRVAFFDPVANSQELVSELLMGMKIEIYVDDTEKVFNLDSIVDEQMSYYFADEIISEEEVVVNNEEAYKAIVDSMGYTITTWVVWADKLYTIVGYIGDTEDKEKYGAKYSEIVAKFEFRRPVVY